MSILCRIEEMEFLEGICIVYLYVAGSLNTKDYLN
jgi:hypothetical protein